MSMPSKAVEIALRKVRSICLALPEAKEVEAWGHPTFRAGKKMFAAFGGQGSVITIGMNVGHKRQAELLEQDRFFLTPYAAHRVWISLWIDNKTDWDEVAELVLEAYRQVALKRMLQALKEES
jgi:predicted DNA-binding protein (MmcQ/YjbR family)